LTKREFFGWAVSDQVSRPTAWQRHGAQIFCPQEVPGNLLALIEADCQRGLYHRRFDTVNGAWFLTGERNFQALNEATLAK